MVPRGMKLALLYTQNTLPAISSNLSQSGAAVINGSLATTVQTREGFHIASVHRLALKSRQHGCLNRLIALTPSETALLVFTPTFPAKSASISHYVKYSQEAHVPGYFLLATGHRPTWLPELFTVRVLAELQDSCATLEIVGVPVNSA